MTDSIYLRRLAARLAALEEARSARAPQLAYSALEDGAIREFSLEGVQTAQYGQQHDGTSGAATLVSPPPPQTTPPIVTVVPGGISVEWDGYFVDSATGIKDERIVAPMDFARVDVVVATPGAVAGTESVSNPTGSDYMILSAGSEGTEQVVPGGELVGSATAGDVTIRATAMASMDQFFAPKFVRWRIRRDDVNGAILAEHRGQATRDYNDGKDDPAMTLDVTYVDHAPTTGRYVLTVQATDAITTIYSDRRQFSLSWAVYDFIAVPPTGAITSPRGGKVLVAVPPGAYQVALVVRTTAGRAGPASSDRIARSVTQAASTGDVAGAIGSLSLDALSDVETDGATAGQVLTFDGGLWTPATPSGGGGGGGGDGVLPPDRRWTPGAGQVSVDEFDDATIASSWVKVDKSGSESRVTWAEDAGVLSARNSGGDGDAEAHAMVRPVSDLAVGDAYETVVRILASSIPSGTNAISGIVLADGAAAGSGSELWGLVWRNSEAPGLYNVAFANLNGYFTLGSFNNGGTFPAFGEVFMRVVKTAAGTFRLDISPNGVQWLPTVTSAYAPAVTHVGLVSSSWSSNVKHVIDYGYLRRSSGVA